MYPIMQEVSKLSELATSNPQAVMQRYQQDPQVKYLLALNEAKRLKDAMQRNQAMQSPTQPTVVQSLEQQSGLASLAAPPGQGDMAQDVGGVLQFQAKKQQENLQRMAQQGLPAAPGAAGAMTPQAMAAGGIVAFDRGGGVGGSLEAELGPESKPAERATKQQIAAMTLQELQEYNRSGKIPERLAGPTPAAQPELAPGEGLDRTMMQMPPSAPPAPPTAPAAPAAGAAPTTPPAAGAAPAAPTFPTLEPAPGPREPTAFEEGIQKSVLASANTKPLSQAQEAANEVERRMAYTAAERKPAQDQLAGLRALLDERRASDRERQLSAFLRSAGGGRTFGETMGRASAGAAAAGEQAYQERLKGIEAIGKLGMEDVERGRFGRVAGAKEIGPLTKQGLEALSSAQSSGVNLAGTLSRERTAYDQLDQRNKEFAADLESKGFDRQNAFQIAAMRQQSEREVAAAAREATSQSRKEALITNLQRNEDTTIARHEANFNAKLRLLQASMIPGSPEEKAAKQQIAILEADKNLAIANTRRDYMRLRNQVLKTSGATVTEAAE